MIGIIGAMHDEVAQLKEHMKDVKITTKASMNFYKGTLNGTDVVIVQSGIGKVNAAICTQILADDYHVDCVINTGIAGSLNADINIGDIVLSTDLVEHDMDAVAFGYPLGQIPQMDTYSFAADSRLRQIAFDTCKKCLPDIQVFEGRIVSGDQFVSDPQKKQWLIDNFSGYCTEMEGAAIAHAAYQNGIPVLVIRAISDKADDSASMDYPAFEAMAIANSVTLLLEMAGALS